MNIIVCGIHLRDCNKDFFEQFYRDLVDLEHSRCFVISTCNRIEIYLLEEDQLVIFPIIEQYLKHLYVYKRERAFYHICSVASGLDSNFIGESNIKYQIKKAYEEQGYRQRSEMHFFIQKAFKVSKEIRNQYIDERNVHTLEQYLVEKIRELTIREKILFVGYSAINRTIAESVIRERLYTQVYFCSNREKIEYQQLSRENIKEWVQFDCVIVATKNQGDLLHVDDLNGSKKRLLVFDLSMPRIVDPEIAAYCTLIDMETINREKSYQNNIYREARGYAMQRAVFFRNLSDGRSRFSRSAGCQESLERELCP